MGGNISQPVRSIRDNEAKSLASADGKTVFAIVQRQDGLYEFYTDSLYYDTDEEIYDWSYAGLPNLHMFGTIIDAEAEIIAQYGHMFSAN